ncbi:DUF3500 domain-containing protein [Lentisphaera profundi]|uniref:DUF3500 domain-containing protein n=1 Tax=Lentisphaera profundi TaxID=1658616 RepID=A0ABY7VXP3_9BACT|nr:DUF3500 domain-containing protein [Lentisphaera profundi]WDE97632.1 DUF3500 domain-containing protein [Lentisphaera profundi]
MKKIFLLSLIVSSSLFGHGFDEWYQDLNEKQKALVGKEFNSAERTQWHYIPIKKRKGLSISEMTQEQSDEMFHIMAHVFSEQGIKKVKAVIEMEKILREVEGEKRDPKNFYFTLFGKVNEGKWGFSFEGHHISVNFTFEDKKMISGTPLFFGANPAKIFKNSSSTLREGERPLAFAEDAAFDIVKSFNEQQKVLAHKDETTMRDMKEAKNAFPGKYDDFGIHWKQLNPGQQQTLGNLIRKAYLDDLNSQYASQAWKEIEDTKDSLRFAYYGGVDLQSPHHYRIIGSDLVILLFNTQNGTQNTKVNHVHQIWRSRKNDFGGK